MCFKNNSLHYNGKILQNCIVANIRITTESSAHLHSIVGHLTDKDVYKKLKYGQLEIKRWTGMLRIAFAPFYIPRFFKLHRVLTRVNLLYAIYFDFDFDAYFRTNSLTI